MAFKHYFLIIILMLLFSCNNPDKLFNHEVETRRVDTCSINLLLPARCFSSSLFLGLEYVYELDSAHLILHFPGKDTLLSIYDKNTDVIETTLIRKGRGPSEAASIGGVDVKYGNGTTIDVVMTNGLYSCKYDDLESVDSEFLPYLDRPIVLSFRRPDNSFLCQIFDNGVLSYKLYGAGLQSEIKSIDLFKDNGRYFEDHAFFFKHSVCLKPDGSKAAFLMRYSDTVHIRNLDNDEGVTVVGYYRNKALKKEIETIRDNNSKKYTTAVACDSFIIGKFNACSDNDMDVIFRVFSWDGILLGQFRVDEPIFSIALSHDGKRFYGVTSDERIFEYSIDANCYPMAL